MTLARVQGWQDAGMRRALVLVPLLPLVLLAGCGGDDGDPKEEFVAAANSICADADKEIKGQSQPSDAAGLRAYADALVAILEKARTDLEALALPEDDADELRDKLIDPLRKDVESGKAFADELDRAKDAELLGLLGKRPSPTVDVGFARSYGLDACADAIS